ncbi:hypothetical protein AVEN_130594-1 [Araneus ventricosus]|uniref:Uncharacterized protein n=1 Tax=Araneus ventricosus TaxID=182803 RepID=A0A4Y2U2M6_ARAVE|nr:hypothetical protein AVEN_130594-1 [Araneus ventricosus]
MRHQISKIETKISDPDPPEKQITIASLIECLGSFEKELKNLETIDYNEEGILAAKQEKKMCPFFFKRGTGTTLETDKIVHVIGGVVDLAGNYIRKLMIRM